MTIHSLTQLRILALVALLPQISSASGEQRGRRPSSPCENIYNEIKQGFEERLSESPPPEIESAFAKCRSAEDQMMQTGMSSELRDEARSAMGTMIEHAEKLLGPPPRTEAKPEKQDLLKEVPSFRNHL
jgi:hypothetical protein